MKKFLTVTLVILMSLAAGSVWAVETDACENIEAHGWTGCEWACRCAVQACEPDLPSLRPPTEEERGHQLNVRITCNRECAATCDATRLSGAELFNCVSSMLEEQVPDSEHFASCRMPEDSVAIYEPVTEVYAEYPTFEDDSVATYEPVTEVYAEYPAFEEDSVAIYEPVTEIIAPPFNPEASRDPAPLSPPDAERTFDPGELRPIKPYRPEGIIPGDPVVPPPPDEEKPLDEPSDGNDEPNEPSTGDDEPEDTSGICNDWVVSGGSVACCLVVYGDVSGDVSLNCAEDPCALFYREFGSIPDECRPSICATNPEAPECLEPVAEPTEVATVDSTPCDSALSIRIRPEDLKEMDDGSQALLLFGEAELVFDPANNAALNLHLNEGGIAPELTIRQIDGFAPLNADQENTQSFSSSDVSVTVAVFKKSITSATEPIAIPMSFGRPPDQWNNPKGRKDGIARQAFEMQTTINGELISCPVEFDYYFGVDGGGGCSLANTAAAPKSGGLILALFLGAMALLFTLRRGVKGSM